MLGQYFLYQLLHSLNESKGLIKESIAKQETLFEKLNSPQGYEEIIQITKKELRT